MFLKENDMSIFTGAFREFDLWRDKHEAMKDEEIYSDAEFVFWLFDHEVIALTNKLYEAEMLVIDLRDELAALGG
jgi:hypothetical protein